MKKTVLLSLIVLASGCSLKVGGGWIPPDQVIGVPKQQWDLCRSQVERAVNDLATEMIEASAPYSPSDLNCITARALLKCGEAFATLSQKNGIADACLADAHEALTGEVRVQCEESEDWRVEPAVESVETAIANRIAKALGKVHK